MNARRAVGYVRVSDESQVEGHSLAAQRREIERYCEREGLTLVGQHADEGVSAYTDQIAKRPGLAALLDAARAGAFDVVVVHTIDRWARNVSVQRQALQALGQSGVGFVSVVENFDFSTPSGRLMLTMIGGVSEFFSDQLGVHVAKGLRERAASGLPAGPVPFGYRSTSATTPATVVAEEADAVRTAYTRRIRGDSNGEIAAWLNAEGFQPRGKNALFTAWAVRDLLKTRFYAGVVTFRREEFVGQHEAIVDEEVYRAAQLRRSGPRPRRQVTGPSGVLQGRVFCARCGERLQAERNMSNRPRYRERHGQECASNGRSVIADIIDAQLGDIWTSLELPDDWRGGIARLAAEDAGESERANLEAKKQRIGVAFVDGALSDTDYRRMVDDIDSQLIALAPASPVLYEDAAALLGNLPALWERAAPDERRRLVAPMMSAVYVDLGERQVRGLTPTPGFDALLRGAVRCRPDARAVLIDQRTGVRCGSPLGGVVETGEN